MGIQIEDGLGRGFSAQVDDEGHFVVDAIILSELAHQSEAHGLAMSITSTYLTTIASQEMFSFQNTADEHFHVNEITFGSSIANTFALIEVTGGTPAGTTISAQNLNLISGVAKSHVAFGNGDAGVLTGNILGKWRVPASQAISFDLQDAIVLGTNDIIAVEVFVIASVEVTLTGFWDV